MLITANGELENEDDAFNKITDDVTMTVARSVMKMMSDNLNLGQT